MHSAYCELKQQKSRNIEYKMFSLFKIKNTGINLIEFVAKYSKKSANISLNYENKNPR